MKRPAQSITAGVSDRDIHLVGGPRTIRAFHELGALGRLELVILPLQLGKGIALSPPGAPRTPLQLLQADRTFPDGSAELVYATT